MGSSLSSHPAYNCINTFQIKDLPFFPLLPPFSSQFFFFAYFTFSFLASFLALFLLFAYDSFSSPYFSNLLLILTYRSFTLLAFEDIRRDLAVSLARKLNIIPLLLSVSFWPRNTLTTQPHHPGNGVPHPLPRSEISCRLKVPWPEEKKKD